MSETNLKPCPFCGDDPGVEHYDDGWLLVACQGLSCGVAPATPSGTSLEEEHKLWNTRPGEEAAREEGRQQERERVQAIRKEIERCSVDTPYEDAVDLVNGCELAYTRDGVVIQALNRSAVFAALRLAREEGAREILERLGSKEEAEAEGAKDGR